MSEQLRGDLSGLPRRGLVVVGLSGGADSTALAHWLAGRVSPDRLVLAHVNHLLRGEEADRDEAAARAFAQSLGLRFALLREDVGKLAKERGMGLEECGRAVRYGFFESLAQGEDDRVLTAHNADDNAETMLLNLCRGAGLSGLCGIPRQRGKVLRPFLRVSRREIEAYCAAHCLSYVTDSSNLCGAFARNRLRLEVLPVLRELNPRFAESAARTSELLSQDRDFLLGEAEKLLARARGKYGLEAALLRHAPEPPRTLAVRLWLEEQGCRDLERKHLEAAGLCLERGGAVPLPGDRILRCSGGLLTLSQPEKEGSEPFEREVPLPLEGRVRVPLPGGRSLILEKKPVFWEKDTQKIHNLDFKNALDYDIITGNLVVRTRREGDRFSPAGRGVSKPLKQVFREAGLPADRRGGAALLECGGRLAFCEGAGVSQEFRVTERTGAALFVSVEETSGKENKEGSGVVEHSAMMEDIEEVLFTERQVAVIVERIGKEISRDYAGKNLLLVSVLKGSVVFMADLMRSIDIPARIDFMATSSYGAAAKSSGVVKIIKDLDINLEGYDIVLVEDILDSGKTLSYLIELLKGRNPKSIRICTLFDKPERREVPVEAAYVGAQIPDAFIVGYGLDYDEKYRNLPFVGVLKPSVYE